MRLISATSLVLIAGFGMVMPASAEQLQMPAEAVQSPQEAVSDEPQMPVESALPPQDAISLEMPIKGMTKEAVRYQYGEPNQMHPAVGEPPISRWEYGRYTVYFEHEYVIHSVIHDTRRFSE